MSESLLSESLESTENTHTLPQPLDICNFALAKLGESPISALDPNASPAARQCYLHYHPARRELLCTHRWTFAQKIVNLPDCAEAQCTTAPNIPYQHQYLTPSDCLRVLNINQQQWMLVGRHIYTTNPSNKTIKLNYIYDCEDTDCFDPLFTEALATKIACKICIPLTSSTTAQQSLIEQYKKISLPEAQHINAVQSYSNDTPPFHRRHAHH